MVLSENMKLWLRKIYDDAINESVGCAENEDCWALGSNGVQSELHKINAMEHRQFINILDALKSNIDNIPTNDSFDNLRAKLIGVDSLNQTKNN